MYRKGPLKVDQQANKLTWYKSTHLISIYFSGCYSLTNIESTEPSCKLHSSCAIPAYYSANATLPHKKLFAALPLLTRCFKRDCAQNITRKSRGRQSQSSEFDLVNQKENPPFSVGTTEKSETLLRRKTESLNCHQNIGKYIIFMSPKPGKILFTDIRVRAIHPYNILESIWSLWQINFYLRSC